MGLVRPVAMPIKAGGLNHESRSNSDVSSRPSACKALGDSAMGARGKELSIRTSRSDPPSSGTLNRCSWKLSCTWTMRRRPDGSATTPSPARIFRASLPAEGPEERVLQTQHLEAGEKIDHGVTRVDPIASLPNVRLKAQ